MKKVFLLSVFCLANILIANAQRFAMIDMEYILENIPEYKQASTQLESLSEKYQKAIESKAKETEELKARLEAAEKEAAPKKKRTTKKKAEEAEAPVAE